MSEDLLRQLMKQADALTPHEQLRLVTYLVESVNGADIKPKPRRNVMEFCGIAPNHLGGMDAQEYVNRMRRGEFPELEIEVREKSEH